MAALLCCKSSQNNCLEGCVLESYSLCPVIELPEVWLNHHYCCALPCIFFVVPSSLRAYRWLCERTNNTCTGRLDIGLHLHYTFSCFLPNITQRLHGNFAPSMTRERIGYSELPCLTSFRMKEDSIKKFKWFCGALLHVHCVSFQT